MSFADLDDKVVEAVVMKRVFWRLMPFLLGAYLICYIDRVNVGFAALQMNRAIGIDPKTYGLGAGIFFLGYFILEVPSNLGLEHFGARRWIARIMVSWGVLSAAFALIGGPVAFLAGTYACKGPFWALSSEWPAPSVAAAGLAQINALGNLSGFFCNYLIGWIRDETGSFPLAIMPIAALAAAGAVAVVLVGHGQPRTVAMQR